MSAETTTDEGASILLVDDMEDNLVALEAVLGSLNEPLVRARSGEEAMKALLRQRFAVVLLDIRMPGMDGFETGREHQAARPDQGRAHHLPDGHGRRRGLRLPRVRDGGRRLSGEAVRPVGPARQGQSSSTCTARTGSWSACSPGSSDQFDELAARLRRMETHLSAGAVPDTPELRDQLRRMEELLSSAGGARRPAAAQRRGRRGRRTARNVAGRVRNSAGSGGTRSGPAARRGEALPPLPRTGTAEDRGPGLRLARARVHLVDQVLYFRSTTGRFIFRLGVSSPCSTSRSRGRRRNFLIVCQRCRPSLSCCT